MDALSRAVLTTVTAVVLAAAAYLSELGLVAVCAAVALVVALGWPAILDLPARVGSRVVVALGGLGGVAVVFATRGEPFLQELSAVVALAVLLTFVHELVRPDGRVRMVDSAAGTIAGVLLAVAAAGWVAAGRTVGGTTLVVIAALALAVGTATSVVPFSPWLGLVVAVAVSAAVGAGLSWALPDVTPLAGGLVGLAVGVLGAVVREGFERLPTLTARTAAAAAVVVPVSVTGSLAYVVGRLLIG